MSQTSVPPGDQRRASVGGSMMEGRQAGLTNRHVQHVDVLDRVVLKGGSELVSFLIEARQTPRREQLTATLTSSSMSISSNFSPTPSPPAPLPPPPPDFIKPLVGPVMTLSCSCCFRNVRIVDSRSCSMAWAGVMRIWMNLSARFRDTEIFKEGESQMRGLALRGTRE